MGLSGLYGDWATNSSREGGEVQADAWPRITPAKCRIFFYRFWVGLLGCWELFGWSIGLLGTFWLVYWAVGNFLVGLLGCWELFEWANGLSGTSWLVY